MKEKAVGCADALARGTGPQSRARVWTTQNLEPLRLEPRMCALCVTGDVNSALYPSDLASRWAVTQAVTAPRVAFAGLFQMALSDERV